MSIELNNFIKNKKINFKNINLFIKYNSYICIYV